MNKTLILTIIVIIILAALGTYHLNNPAKETLRISTTTSLEDTGLLEELEDTFEKKYPNMDIQIVSGGTGITLERGKRGDADLIIVHDQKREEEFINEGYGTNRYSFAYNYFYIVGPKEDPAKINGTKTASEAFQKILTEARKNPKIKFVSRGDNSGTHTREIEIWKKTGTELNKIRENEWYIETGSGMADTLKIANEKQTYTLTDSGTYLAYKDKLKLTAYITNDRNLLNVYTAIPINPEKIKGTNYDAAMKFINFLLSKEGQEIITNYGKHGKPLFKAISSKNRT